MMNNTEHLHPNGESHHSHGETLTGGARIMIGDSGSALSLFWSSSVSTSAPMTCRWYLLAARSRCRLVAEFHELRNERFELGNCDLDVQALMVHNGIAAIYERKKYP